MVNERQLLCIFESYKNKNEGRMEWVDFFCLGKFISCDVIYICKKSSLFDRYYIESILFTGFEIDCTKSILFNYVLWFNLVEHMNFDNNYKQLIIVITLIIYILIIKKSESGYYYLEKVN